LQCLAEQAGRTGDQYFHIAILAQSAPKSHKIKLTSCELSRPLSGKLLLTKFVVDHIDQHVDLAVGQLQAKRRHAVAALGDLFADLGFGLKFELADPQARHDLAVVERFAIGLRAVTDGTVLPKKRGVVGFAVGDRVACRR